MKRITIRICKYLSRLALIAASVSIEITCAQAQITFVGVAAGDASENEAVLWTRAVDTNAPSAAALIVQLAANDATLT